MLAKIVYRQFFVNVSQSDTLFFGAGGTDNCLLVKT